MTLQDSGQISLNQIHIEAGGTSGTQASINDTDIRDIINVSSGSEIEFKDFYGKTGATHTITLGTSSIYGFNSSKGSISPTTMPSSTDIVYMLEADPASTSALFFKIRGVSSIPSDNSFTSITFINPNGTDITIYEADADGMYTHGTYNERTYSWYKGLAFSDLPGGHYPEQMYNDIKLIMDGAGLAGSNPAPTTAEIKIV
jgi:hypothetical protein